MFEMSIWRGGKGEWYAPIKPEKRLNVLGMRTPGLTSIRTPFAVCM